MKKYYDKFCTYVDETDMHLGRVLRDGMVVRNDEYGIEREDSFEEYEEVK